MGSAGSKTEAPIVGLFDSGVGGLSLLRRMLAVTRPPWGKILYLADLARFPYGPRPAEEVRRFASAGVRFLAVIGADLAIVACNTAASAGLRAGVEPAPAALPLLDIIGPGARHVSAVARETGAARVVVMGTEGTIRSRVWEQALRDAGYRGPFMGWPCPFLASLIEEGRNGSVPREAVAEATRGFRPSPAPPDIVVLGCTHYAFAKDAFEDVLAGPAAGKRPVRVVDPAQALVSELVSVLGNARPGSDGANRPTGAEGVNRPTGERMVEVRFLTTGRASHLRERAGQLLADELAGGSGRLRLDEVTEVSFPEETS